MAVMIFATQKNGYCREDVDNYIERLSKAYQTAYNEHKTLSSKYEEMSAKYKETNSKYKELSSRVEDAKNDNEDANSKYEALSAKYEDAKNKREEMSAKYEDAKSKREEMSAKYEDANSKYEEMSNKYEALRKKFETLEQDRDRKETGNSSDISAELITKTLIDARILAEKLLDNARVEAAEIVGKAKESLSTAHRTLVRIVGEVQKISEYQPDFETVDYSLFDDTDGEGTIQDDLEDTADIAGNKQRISVRVRNWAPAYGATAADTLCG